MVLGVFLGQRGLSCVLALYGFCSTGSCACKGLVYSGGHLQQSMQGRGLSYEQSSAISL